MAKRSQTSILREKIERELNRLESRGYEIAPGLREKATKSWQSVRKYAKENFEILRRGATKEGEKYEERERRIRSERQRASARRRRVKAKMETARVIYANVLDMIHSHETNGAAALARALSQEISTYGYFNVMFSMAGMPAEIISKAQEIVTFVYKDKAGSKQLGEMMRAFFTMIHASFPTEEEERTISELSDLEEDIIDDEE